MDSSGERVLAGRLNQRCEGQSHPWDTFVSFHHTAHRDNFAVLDVNGLVYDGILLFKFMACI